LRNPPAITEADIQAVQAWKDGTANADQQLRSARWVLNEACRIIGVADPDCTDREAAVHEGRRTVGMLIARMGDPGLLKKVRDEAKAATTRGKTK